MGFNLYRSNEEISRLWNNYYKTIYPLCYSYFFNTTDADKAVMRVFIGCMKYEEDFDSAESEKRWLMLKSEEVCTNMVRVWWQKENYEDYPEYDTAYAHSDKSDNTAAKIQPLPPGYNLIFFLYYSEHLNTSQIASLTGINQAVIRSRLHSAKKLLNDCCLEITPGRYINLCKKSVPDSEKQNILLETLVNKAEDEEIVSNIVTDEDSDMEENMQMYENDEKAQIHALLRANIPKLLPGIICIIIILVISIRYFINNP